ncbi:MAG: hypothetical protein C0623_13225 [Desulfuromonas sp.]|nr:MAG: hypothetical protein C0623_13225 [Desulfuromonas sp.]
MNLLRAMAIMLTQLPLLYYELGRRDLLGGFNQTDHGLGLLVGLFVVVPIGNFIWLVSETVRSFRKTRKPGLNRAMALPFVALLMLFESLAIDLYLLSQARM